MRAIILAAGRGSRMGKLTEERPKCLVNFNGKTLLSRLFEVLNTSGIDKIAVVTGYKRELVSNIGIKEFHNKKWNETNMVSSLVCADEWLASEPCIVSYSDIFYDASAIKSLINSNSKLAITYDPKWRELWEQRFDDPLTDAETFKLNDDQCITDIGGKATSVQEIEGQYMGLLRFTPDSWKELLSVRKNLNKYERASLDMTSCLRKIVEAGSMPIKAIAYYGKWGEVDSIEDLKVYQSNLYP